MPIAMNAAMQGISGGTTATVTTTTPTTNDTLEIINSTFPSEQIKSNAGTYGYVGSKKGFVSTKSSTGTTGYIAGLISSPNGDCVEIQLWRPTADQHEMHLATKIYPRVPIRIMMSDEALLKNLESILITQPRDQYNKLLFNPEFGPGIGSEIIDFSSSFNTSRINLPYYEINLLKENFSFLIGKPFRISKSVGSGEDIYININSIRADDYNVSIYARPDSVDPELDHLYIGMTYAVSIDCNIFVGMNEFSTALSNRIIRYSVPLVLYYKINKTTIINNSVDWLEPFTWTYPIPIEKNDILDSNYSNQFLWNQKVIKGSIINGPLLEKQTNAFWQKDSGSLVSIAWNSSQNKLNVATFNPVPLFSNYNLKISLFNLPSANNSFLSNILVSSSFTFNDFKAFCKTLTIEIGQNVIWVCGTIDSVDIYENKCCILFAYNKSTGALIGVTLIRNVNKADITILSNNICLFYLVGKVVSPISIAILPDTLITADIFCKKYYDGATFFNEPNITHILDSSNTSEDNKLSCGEHNKYNQSNMYYVNTDTDNVSLIPSLYGFPKTKYYINGLLENDLINITSFSNLNVNSLYISNTIQFKNVTRQICDISSSGLLEGEYLKAELNQKNDIVFNVEKITKTTIDPWIFGDAIVEYWKDPAGYYNLEQENNESNNIKILVNVTGCYGIFSNVPRTINSYDENLKPVIDPVKTGGIALKTTDRPDLSFKYGGIGYMYTSTYPTSSGYYWAQPDSKFKITCKDKNGLNLLSRGTESNGFTDEVPVIIWNYSENGYFNCNFYLDLKFPIGDDFGRTFDDPNFSLSNVQLDVSAINNWGQVFSSKLFTINIDPPNLSCSLDSSVYKTVNDITFSMTRDCTQNSDTFTTVEDINVFTDNQDGTAIAKVECVPSRYVDYVTSIATYTFPKNTLKRGSSRRIEFLPKLFGIKPGKTTSNISERTKEVTYCGGHQYWLDDVKMYMGLSGSYGSDVIGLFLEDTLPIIYADVNNNMMHIKVTFDVNHEEWNLQGLRTSYSETNVYPCLSGAYIMAVKNPTYSSWTADYKTTFLPVPGDNNSTYPNVSGAPIFYPKSIWNDVLLYGPTHYNGLYASGIYLGNTDVSLSNQELIIPIHQPGSYRLYLSVEDEFGQFSSWCLTNPSKMYNYPFGVING